MKTSWAGPKNAG